MTLPLSFLDTATPQQVKALSPEQLQSLKERLQEEIALNKRRKQLLDSGLQLKYLEAAKIALRATQRDAGITRIKDGDVVVIAEIPKKVIWDQSILISIVEKLSPDVSLPGLSLTYAINENAYKTWTYSTQARFMPARTVTIGAPLFKLVTETLL